MKLKKLFWIAPIMVGFAMLSGDASSTVAPRHLKIFLTSRGEIHRFLDRFPSGDQEVVITRGSDREGPLSPRLEISVSNQLYVAPLDGNLSSSTNSGHLPHEVGRLGDYVFFDLKKSSFAETESSLHKDDLRLIQVSNEEKTDRGWASALTQEANTLSEPVSDEKLSQFYQLVQKTFDQKFLREKLEIISGVTPVTIDGKTFQISERKSVKGRNGVRDYLKSELENLGFKTWLHQYRGGANFVAQKEGAEPDQLIVLSAHIDSVGNSGADDDGTGVAALIATARVFSQLNHKYSLRILGFDQEEDGLVGSGHYIDSLAQSGEVQKIVSAIHYDMTGYDSNDDGKFHILHCNQNSSVGINKLMLAAIEKLSIPLVNVPACRKRSDHIRYWQYNRPAVMAIEIREQDPDINPCYHRACDKIDTINFKYFEKITQVGALTLMQMAEAEIK